MPPGPITNDPAQSRAGSGATAQEASTAAALDDRLTGLSTRTARLLRKARQAIDKGEVAEADTILASAQSRARDHAEFQRLVGIIRHLQKRRDDALAALRRALELKPSDALILTNLGVALRAAGQIEASLVSLRRACDLAPDLAPAWYNLGRTLAQHAQPEEASAAFEHAMRCDPQHVNARIGYADTLRTLGRVDLAGEQYREALKLPGSIRAWGRLANLKTRELGAQDVAELERLYFSSEVADNDRLIAGFALVRAFENQDRNAEAFAILATWNALQYRCTHWDTAGFNHRNEAIAAAFAVPLKTAAKADFGHEVIFVVGTPNAGSTLVEQVLAAHPQVEGAGELHDLWAVLDGESQRRGSDFPAWVASTTPADWRRLGQEYLDRTARWRVSHPRFTDAGLTNWRIIGAVQTMLPGASFVNCRRDPVEACLTCYRQMFSRGQEFSYDLFELADYWREYDRMARYWHARYPHRIHNLVYEELLADPDSVVPRLLDFCGLQFDAACLRYYETPRSVRTNSSAQVREPLRSDTAPTARYGAVLEPLRLALGVGGVHATSHPDHSARQENPA